MTVDFEQLYNEWHSPLFRYVQTRVYKFGRTDNVAADLTSVVFLKAIEASKRGFEPHTNTKAWLFMIANNVVHDHFRYERRRKDVLAYEEKHVDTYSGENKAGAYADELENIPSNDFSPFDLIASEMGCEYIHRNINRLTDGQAQAIALTIDGCPANGLGELMGQSEGGAKALLYRGRERLRELLSKEAA